MSVVKFWGHHRHRCKCGTPDGPAVPGCQFCDGGLFACTVCGGCEGGLPTHCPGYMMTEAQEMCVYRDQIDYDGRQGWIDVASGNQLTGE